MRSALAVVVVTVPLSILLPACPPPITGPGEGEGEDEDVCTIPGSTAELARPTDPQRNPRTASRPDGAPVNLSCIGSPVTVTQSASVRLQGCIEIFGLGDDAVRGIKVAVFDDAQNPGADTPAHGEVDVAIAADAVGLDCAGVDAANPACLAAECSEEGAFAIEGVPTHVPLTIKVYGPEIRDVVIDTYSFGIVLDYQDNIAVDGVVNYDASLIYRSTYDSIPTVGGRRIDGQEIIGDGVGRAAIAGEIHDCDDVIIGGATVTSNNFDAQSKITYFDGEADPNPDLAELSTNSDGLYVILNAQTSAGKDVHTVAAGILDPACAAGGAAAPDVASCQCVSMGTRTVRAFPDSVTIVTLRGDFPVIQ